MKVGPEKDKGLAEVPKRVIDLAKVGKRDEVGLFSARYGSPYPEVAWILVRLINESREKCTAIINYKDDTSYDITWDEGEIWSFTHNDSDQAQGKSLDRILPYTNGIRRLDYVSNRFSSPVDEAKSVVNLHDVVRSILNDQKEADVLVERILGRLAAGIPSLADIYFKDIDPADVDLPALCAPIMDINPDTDRIFLYGPDFPEGGASV